MLGDLFQQAGHLLLNRGGFFFPGGLVRFGGLHQVVRLHGGEERLHAIVVALAERVELVIVAAGAAQSNAHQAGAHDVGHLRELLVVAAGHHLVARILAQRAQAVEPRGDQGLVFCGRDLIARQLFEEEPVVGLVVIEGPDHVVAIAPGIRPGGVVFVTVGVRIPHHIQPMLAPALAVMRALQEPFHYVLPGAGRPVVHKGHHLGGGGRQAR